MSTKYSIGSMNQLGDAFEVAGFTPDDVTSLRQSKDLPNVLGVLRGSHEIKPVYHVVNLSVPCDLPFDGAEHISPAKSGIIKLKRRGDDLFVNGKKINLFLSEQQKVGFQDGYDLQRVVEDRGGNQSAKILDHLKAHPELWPEHWKKDEKGKTIYVFFWDDIFRDSDGDLCVRFGHWGGSGVSLRYRWLSSVWGPDDFVASVK